ncbi:MAG: GspE/PulE family protein, partial [Planctomycetota bacterium]
GKTTTLYAMVSALDLESTVAVSVEDPVEFHLPLLRQFDVDTDRGFTIFKGLRTLLRMDPDVLLIGEIRDQQSAITAARAALAGRLILATIHAVDAATAIQTLHYLSVPYHILGDCLRLVAAQNLVRRVCIECAESRPLKDSERELFERHDLQPPDQVPTALGCEACNGYGYSGRIGVFETVGVEGDLAHAVGDGAELDELRQHIRRSGAPPMLTDALEKVANGVTTMDEVYQFHWPALEAG